MFAEFLHVFMLFNMLFRAATIYIRKTCIYILVYFLGCGQEIGGGGIAKRFVGIVET